jgi:hypothetical protein
MGLELLKEADLVLNACGRPVPPTGYRFVDLTRVIPFHAETTAAEGSPASTPTTGRVVNKSNTLFLVRGLVISGGLSFRVKWPNGRYLSLHPSGDTSISGRCFPAGLGGAMLAFNRDQPIESGGRMTVEFSIGPVTGTLDLQFWGVLRYLLKDDGGPGGGGFVHTADSSCLVGYPSRASGGPASCIIGYPAVGAESVTVAPYRPGSIPMIPDPIEALEAIPRFNCGPANIMAPEFLIGACANTPEGWVDESFTMFSDPIEVPINEQSFGNTIVVPGSDRVVLKRVRAISVWDDGAAGIPVFSVRFPNGYDAMGGDLIPAQHYWFPFFSPLEVRGGERVLIDVADMQASGAPGDVITTTFEFDCVRRRKQS